MSEWFVEQHKNTKFGFRIKSKLHSKQSQFQKIEVYDTYDFGKVLAIDGFVMITDRDEFVYHELITHIPMSIHPEIKNILIIGAGDGGVLRELSGYSHIENMKLCEIDEHVIEVSKKFFPQVAIGFEDKRADVFVGDGLKYVEETKEKFDLVIVDSTDPIGPGEVLFSKEFYQNVAKILEPKGLMVAQTESPWYEKEMLGGIRDKIGSAFGFQKQFAAPIPTYPLGYWSWTVARNCEIDIEKMDINYVETKKNQLKFVNKSTLKSVFDLPSFYANKV